MVLRRLLIGAVYTLLLWAFVSLLAGWTLLAAGKDPVLLGPVFATAHAQAIHGAAWIIHADLWVTHRG